MVNTFVYTMRDEGDDVPLHLFVWYFKSPYLIHIEYLVSSEKPADSILLWWNYISFSSTVKIIII